MRIAYGCVVGSWDKFHRYVEPHVRDRECITLTGQRSMPPALNSIIDAFTSPERKMPEALVLLHDDLEIIDPAFEEKVDVLVHMLPDLALLGVAGGGGDSIYWWEHDPVGHQLTDVMNIDFGRRTGEVTLIEGSLMVLTPWTMKHLRFDTRFTDFHGYDEIGMQARAAGKQVIVADIDTHHHNPMGYKSPESAAACRVAAQQYREKWNL